MSGLRSVVLTSRPVSLNKFTHARTHGKMCIFSPHHRKHCLDVVFYVHFDFVCIKNKPCMNNFAVNFKIYKRQAATKKSPPVFSGVRVTRSLVLCVCFVDRCLYFCLL